MKANLFAFLILSALTLLTVSAVGATSTAPESTAGATSTGTEGSVGATSATLPTTIIETVSAESSLGNSSCSPPHWPTPSCEDPECFCTSLQQWHPALPCLNSASQCYASQAACEADYGVGNCQSILYPPVE